ncbi:hypothetical protein HERIO_2774 [Hepatospora eriocheir]|uniref:Uncharacterized protein n=1 Tax=Hepatospora eriocheir TaxID=1081669 RepID=A0A1X0Q8L9_9MICR|nr:hypothetical protein HERIO_2774 [Hepatospora eriocheir]
MLISFVIIQSLTTLEVCFESLSCIKINDLILISLADCIKFFDKINLKQPLS